MGYYVSCYGSLKIRPGTHVRRIEEIIEDAQYPYYEVTAECNGDESVEICIDYYGKYFNEDVDSILNAVKPHALGGYLRFHGEDDENWQYVFRDGAFVEESGEILFHDDIDSLERNAIRKRITAENIKNAERILVDNGIGTDEANVVLQAIGYVLLDTELYPD